MARFRILAFATVVALLASVQPGTAIPPGGSEPAMTWSPPHPAAGRDVTFGIEARDPDGVILSATLEFGDGTQETRYAQRSVTADLFACAFGDHFTATVTKQYARPGAYPVRLTIASGACPLTAALQSATTSVGYTLTVGPSSGPAAPVEPEPQR